jgi:hypothetical protein
VWANAGSAHSWIVLKQTGIAANFQLLISCEGSSANGTLLTVVVSPNAGFTGGTTTARPTAVDEVVHLNNTTTFGGQSTAQGFVIHAMQSTDGQCTRIGLLINGIAFHWILIDKPGNPVTGWTNPYVLTWFSIGAITEQVTLATLNTNNTHTKGYGTAIMSLYYTTEGAGSSPLATRLTMPNDLSGEWAITPIGLHSETASNRGRHGTLQDLWFGLAVLRTGSYFLNGASKDFVVFGDLVLPWNNTEMVLG